MRPLLLLPLLLAPALHASMYYVTVAGLGGEPDYEQRFTAQARDLDRIFKAVQGAHVVTLTGAEATRAHLEQTLAGVAREVGREDDFVLVLIGHGSFDGEVYKFNLTGPDVSAPELAAMCDRVSARRQMIVNTTSASGGSVAALTRLGRAVVAATKNGTEKNATVFARYWVRALEDAGTDVDKSDSVSGLEAFQAAERATAAFYESQKRLATEHAVFEDAGRGEPVRTPGKGEGALLGSFTVVRLGAIARVGNDPAKRALLTKKEALEEKIDGLKYTKAAMEPVEYKQQLMAALVALAQVQQELDK